MDTDMRKKYIFSFDAIGTKWEIETDKPLGKILKQDIQSRIEQFDKTYSRFQSDSLISRIAYASQGGSFDFPEDSIALFDLYDHLHKVTSGAIDPLVGRDLELLGYDRNYSLKPESDVVRTREYSCGRLIWSKDIARKGKSIITKRPLVIDIGAIGKGYLVDIISSMLRNAEITEFVVDGSGDLQHLGKFGIQVGLEHPFDPSSVIGVANLKNSALCASAVNRRAWGNGLHHVLDARTGFPVRDVVATWVIADDAIIADGLATALFFTSEDLLSENFSFSYVRMFSDGTAEISQDFEGDVFTLND
jgi:thiamine biosynthesis lipoprotein